MTIVEVNDKSAEKKFIALPRNLYKNDPNFISPLDNDIKDIFESIAQDTN